MAETNEFDAYWDNKLRQRDLEVGVTDGAKGVAGAAVKGTGSLISNLSAGDIARGTRGLVDPTMNKVEEGGVIDTALTWLNDTFDPEGNERKRVSERVKDLQESGSLPKGDGQNKELTVAVLPGLSALAEPLKGAEVVGDIADKAIRPAAKFIGEPIKEAGQGIIESTSPDMQEAMGNPEIFKDGKLGRGAGDPAAWAGVAAQAAGSLIPTVATAAITKNPTAGLGVGMGMSVGQAGDNAYDTAINSNPMDLIDSPIFVGELRKVSQDPEFAELDGAAKVEEAQRRYAELSSSMAKSKPETIAAAAMGTLLGDATIVKTMLGSGAGGAVRGMLKGAATEAPGEFGEEWLQRYVGNETQNQMANTQLVEPMAGTLDAGLHGAAGGAMAGGAMGGTAAKFAKVLHANKDKLTQEQAIQVVESSMKKRGADDATARQVAEQAASMMADPDLAPAADTMADPVVAPSGEQSPLGPSASQFDELRDVPAYLRRDDTAERFKGMAADSEVQRALAGEFGQSVQELVASQMQAGDQGKSLYERAQAGELGLDPFAGNKSAQQVAMENQRPALPLKDVIFAGDANAARGMTKEGHFDDKQAGTGPQFRGAERTRWQSGQEGDVLPPESSSTKPAGELPGAVIEGEAREVGTELPHRDVVYGADQRQPDAKPMRGSATESAVGPLQTLRITRKGKPFATEKEAAMASRKGKEMPVPLNGGGFGVAEIAEVEQVKAAATTQPSVPRLDDINVADSNQPSDLPAQSVSGETVSAPSATAGEASQLAPAIDTGYREVIPVKQPKTEVSNEPVTPVPAISSEGQRDQPGAGEPAAAGAGPAVAGLTDRAGSGDRADLAAPAPVPDGQQQNDPTLTAPATDAGAAVSGRIGEEELRDRDLLKEHGGHWKYRSAVGAGWFTANTKEAAIERAEEAYRKAVSKGEPVPTRDERFAQADAELFSEMDRRYGKMSTPELEAEYQRLGGEVGDLQKSGSGEFNGNGGRRTGAAVSNEGARQVGEERLRLGVYMKMRRDRDTAWSGAKSQQIEPANDWRGGDLFGLAGARNNHGAAPSVPRSGDASAAKGAGGVTEGRLELDGVSIRIPAIDEEQQRLYNQATHRGQGVNFASGISTGVGRILNDLKDAGLLDTVEQRAAAEAEVQAWANEEAINARKLMRDGIKNPSWAITGRSGRKAQSSAAQDAENRRQAAHHKDQSDRITALRGELKKLRPKEVIGKESFNYAWGKAKGMIADYASAQSNGQPNLLASLRKSMNAELARYLQSMGKIDAPNFIKTLKEQDQRLKAAGHDGLVAIVGARSSPGKIISNAIDGRIRFSKQAMAQGEKPAKHLTRKEAELVTKEWFKQYRGASGIDVQIHATQAELEKALGLAAQDGLIRRAAFDDDSGTLHVAADTIANPKRMREILRHEVLAHYGLANVLGDGEYTKLMSRLIQSQKDPSMKPVWDWVNTHYADEDIGTKAEEVVAHLAELEPSAWRRGWDTVVAWVTRALRAVGFVPDGITAAETRSLIEGLGKQLQRTGQDDGGSGGKKFSQEEKPGEDTFKPYPGEAEEYRRQLGKMMASPKSGELVIEMGRTPLVLQAVGAPDLPLRITRDIVRKATNGVKHDVPMPVIEQLPELLHDPIAVFDSKTEQGAKTILIDARDASGRPIITAVHLNAKAGRIDINRIASVYGKDNGIGAMERWIDEGLLRYAREKQNPLGTTQGLQLPKRGSPERVYDSNILSRGDLAKDADKIRDRVAAAGPQASARGEHESTRDDGSLPPDGLKFSQSNSAADSGPALEQSLKQKAAYQAGAALGSVKNWMKQGRPVMLGALTDLQIDQVYRDITGGAVSQYQRLRTQMEADRNDILLDAETRIDPLWDALGKQEKADLSNLMHDATMARLHPDKSLDENSYYQEAKQKLERAKKPETRAAYEAELHIIERNHSELARQYQALTPKAKALYDTMQDTYTKQWESLRGAIEQRLEDLLGVNQGRAMAAEMRQKMEHALQHGPYFPLTRYGDYVVKARKGDEYVREHFERRADAEQAVKQYQRDGYNAVMTVKEEGGGDSANANQLGMEMLSFLDSADGVSKSALKDEIWQAMLRMMPDASYAKHAIHRRRVKGASRDAHRAYLNSVYHYARHVSKIRYGHKMQGELDKLSEQIRAGVAGEPSSLKPEDLEIAQQVLNEMNKRHDLNMNPTGKAWAGSAGNIGFLYYIGPSVASAVVNMTQNFTVMLPQLGAKYGFAKSAAAMTQALGDYVKHGKFKAGTTEAWHSLTRSTTLPADERAILDRLYRAGALDLTQAHSIAAKADTDQQDAKPMGKRWRRAMRWAGATFHNAEVLNREVAALAAYRLLKQAEPTLNGQQYADRVAEMVYDGHGNYAASNRPRYMRNDITKVLTQFKIYSQMMTYVIYSNAIKAAKAGSLKAWKKGVLGKELTQDDLRAIADGKLAAKTLGGVLATHWVMAGVMGLPTPLTFAAYAIAAGLDDDDDRSGEASFRLALTEALGPRAGELLAKGPMDALTNLSIAGRTGLGDLWWRSPKEGTEGDDLAWHAVQQLLGPVAGIGINLARGAGQMTDGHIQRGLETMLPKSIRDVAKSYRQATEGEQTIKGDIIMDDVSTWNVAMQGLGFGSAQMAKNYDAREYIKGKEKRIADKRSQLLTDYYMARKSGEMDEVQEVLERIKMFNSIHHPRERITGKSLALSFKSKLRSNERTQGGVYLNRNREYLREEGRFAD